jgi:hypothetical protein
VNSLKYVHPEEIKWILMEFRHLDGNIAAPHFCLAMITGGRAW